MNSDHKKKMSNIIDFRKKPVSSPKFFSQTQQYWDELEDKRILIDAMMEDAAKELQQRGYNPEDFIVDRNAMYYFLGEPLWETYTDEPEEGTGRGSYLIRKARPGRKDRERTFLSWKICWN